MINKQKYWLHILQGLITLIHKELTTEGQNTRNTMKKQKKVMNTLKDYIMGPKHEKTI